jgi:hypothetical protein
MSNRRIHHSFNSIHLVRIESTLHSHPSTDIRINTMDAQNNIGFDFSNHARNQFLGERLGSALPKGTSLLPRLPLLSSSLMLCDLQQRQLVRPSWASNSEEETQGNRRVFVWVLIRGRRVDRSWRTRTVKRCVSGFLSCCIRALCLRHDTMPRRHEPSMSERPLIIIPRADPLHRKPHPMLRSRNRSRHRIRHQPHLIQHRGTPFPRHLLPESCADFFLR